MVTGYVYRNENIKDTHTQAEDYGPMIGIITGRDNEQVEAQFEAKWGSNDYSLSYCTPR